MKYIYLTLIAIFTLSSCSEPQQNRKYLYDLRLLEQVRWSGDHLTPIPDSFATLVTVQAKHGASTRYRWSAQGRERFGALIQNPSGTLPVQLSDSLYYLVQQAFANIPADSDEHLKAVVESSDNTARKIEISTFDEHTKAALTDGNAGQHTNVILFLLKQSKKPDL
ncbi:hypothetical protein [Hymenobacter rubripertinctus]|uniref:hypothetical protein n=1 Tax=Hymenobacter rubripertinctus TaxID=2029981 RepID=UPI0011C3F006|nr:hypothetical protein [Hymenobacter rubripertinctus]